MRRRPAAVGAALVLIIAGQRALESAAFYPSLAADVFYPSVPLLDRIPRSDEPFRVVGTGEILIPQFSAMYGLEDVRTYTGMTLARYDRRVALWSAHQPNWYNRVDDLGAPFLSLLNVRYALAPAGGKQPPGWSVIASDRGTLLLENRRALARAFLPRTILIAEKPFAAFPGFEMQDDYGERSWIAVAGAAPREEQNGPGSLVVRRSGLNTLNIHSRLERNAWAVVSQAAWDGWHAYVDGRPAKVHIANGMLLALHLPGGVHDIRLVYRPQSFVAGRAISIATIVTMIAGAVIRSRRRRVR